MRVHEHGLRWLRLRYEVQLDAEGIPDRVIGVMSDETERRQVGARNVAASSFAAKGRRTWRAAWRPNIRDDTPDGAASRANLVRVAEEEQKKADQAAKAQAEQGKKAAEEPKKAEA